MFQVNDKVYCKKYGTGIVRKIDGFSDFMTYLVRFKNGTLAWLPKKNNHLKIMQE